MTKTLNNMPLPMNADILIFKNPQLGEIRVKIKKNGKAVFSALNVAKALGYTNPKESVSNICLGGVISQLPVEDGFLLVKFIKHRDVYRLVNNLWSTRAKVFERWFENDILPTIRNHKVYMKNLADQKPIYEILGLLQRIKDEKDVRAEIQQNSNRAKIIFADAMMASDCRVTIGGLAKALQQNDVEIDEAELYQWMRKKGYLDKWSGFENYPTQKAMDLELFVINYNILHRTYSVSVTGKGLVLFLNKFLS